MICRLNNQEYSIAEVMYDIFQASYAVEAALLQAIDFPPLKRTILEFISSKSDFYAYYNDNNIAGLIEVKSAKDVTHIQSLVVYPNYFRQGIGTKLVQYVIDTYDTNIFTVETGVDNYPAIKLYKNFAFLEQCQWDTDHGIRKIRLKRIV